MMLVDDLVSFSLIVALSVWLEQKNVSILSSMLTSEAFLLGGALIPTSKSLDPQESSSDIKSIAVALELAAKHDAEALPIAWGFDKNYIVSHYCCF